MTFAGSFLLLSFISYTYDPSSFGDLAISLSVISFFTSVYTRQTILAFARFVPILDSQRTFRRVVVRLIEVLLKESTLSLLMSFSALLGWFLLAQHTLLSPPLWLAFVTLAGLTPFNLGLFTTLRGLGHRRPTLTLQCAIPFIRFLLAFLPLAFVGIRLHLLVIYATESAITTVVLLCLLARINSSYPKSISSSIHQPYNVLADIHKMRKSIGIILPMCFWLFQSFSQWPLELFHGLPAVGSFNMLQQVFFTPIVALNYTFISHFTPDYFSAPATYHPFKRFLSKYRKPKLLIPLLLIACLGILLYLLLANLLISKKYSFSSLNLILMTSSSILFSFAEICSQAFYRSHDIAGLMKRVVFFVGVYLLSALLLIPPYGETGATLALFLSSLCYALSIMSVFTNSTNHGSSIPD